MQTQTTTSSKKLQNSSGVQVVEATTRSQIKSFIELPRKLYTDKKSRYVMPLELHVKMMMGKVGTPQKHFFLAYKNNKVVARLGVKVHNYQGHEALHFGFFECDLSTPEAAQALVKAAHEMYPQLKMMGPFHFRQEDPYVGILVEGFQYDPYFLMPYNPPEYDQILKDAGLEKVMDLYTYTIEDARFLPQKIVDDGKLAIKEHGLQIRALDKSNLDKEARIIAGIFNDALSKNWGYEEFEDTQINEMVSLLKLFIDARMVTFAIKDGKEVGCLLMIPNYNPLIKPSGGKLTPALVWRFLTQKKSIDNIRGYALGVLKTHHGMKIGSALTADMFERGPKIGYLKGEISWILANNGPMNELTKAMGGKHNKVYRIYEKFSLTSKNLQ